MEEPDASSMNYQQLPINHKSSSTTNSCPLGLQDATGYPCCYPQQKTWIRPACAVPKIESLGPQLLYTLLLRGACLSLSIAACMHANFETYVRCAPEIHVALEHYPAPT